MQGNTHVYTTPTCTYSLVGLHHHRLPGQPCMVTRATRDLKDNHKVCTAGFIVALIVGLSWPWLGDTISSWKVCIRLVQRQLSSSAAGFVRIAAQQVLGVQIEGYRVIPTFHLCTIFVISGLTLKTQDAIDAFKAPAGLIFGLISILGLTPLLGFAFLKIPFDNEAFATGFAIFCSVPTTLSSGIALVNAVRSSVFNLFDG